MRINLRRRNVRVAEHHLNGSKVGPVIEQMRGERMPQHMGADRGSNAGAAAMGGQQAPETDSAYAAAAPVEEQSRLGASDLTCTRCQHWSPFALVQSYPLRRMRANRNQPLSVALADAIAACTIPVIEVHISNIYAREEYRHTSITGAKCIGVISGFGYSSYCLAVNYVDQMNLNSLK